MTNVPLLGYGVTMTADTPLRRLGLVALFLLGPAASAAACALSGYGEAHKGAFVLVTTLVIMSYVIVGTGCAGPPRSRLLAVGWSPLFVAWVLLKLLWDQVTRLCRWVKTGQVT